MLSRRLLPYKLNYILLLPYLHKGLPRRWLNVHEYASHELMRKYDVDVCKGSVASTEEEAEQIFNSFGKLSWKCILFLPGQDCVIKAQILAGGRGKGTFSNGYQGGVHIATTYDS